MNARDIDRAAAAQGWTIEQRKAGHMAYHCPVCGRTLFAGFSPSDHRAMKNHVAAMRRHGFTWRGRGGVHQ